MNDQIYGKELCWYPAEMNIPITYFGWFWRPLFEIFFTRSVRNLTKCYFNSVGANATLLINVPPNNKGELPKKYIYRLIKAKVKIEKYFHSPVNIDKKQKTENGIILTFQNNNIRTVVISEDITKSQRIENFRLIANGQTVYSGTTVGFKKICILKKPVKNCTELKVVIDKCRNEPNIKSVKIYA